MIDYYDGQMTDIMPPSYTMEATVKALSAALRVGTRLLRQYAQYAYVYCSIDTLPDDILDYLAIELRTQYYSDAFDIETKRALVRSTMTWYMYAGTPAAVEELIDIVFGSGEVKEWFEYDGTRYGFAIVTDALITDVAFDYVMEMVKRVKNTRSHLMAIVAERESNVDIHAGVGKWQVYKAPPILEVGDFWYVKDTRTIYGKKETGLEYDADTESIYYPGYTDRYKYDESTKTIYLSGADI